ncbi:MAG: proprotein convertase P-domain-containing protein [Bacteroidetes bacterium]|nr:proprotein convertase P-domain-containing protein [Bacteroidota bacterium]
MFWNKAASFTGTDSSHVAVPDSPSLDMTGSITLECWINPDSSVHPFSQMLIQKRTPATNTTGYALNLQTGKVVFTVNNLVGIVGKTVIQNKKWTHIAGRLNITTGTFSIYINGALDTSAVIPSQTPAVNNDSVIIGIGRGIGGVFSGKMDNIRIWNRALTAAEISKYYRTSLGVNTGVYSGLVLSLTFQKEESTSPVFSVLDYSGTGNNGYARNLSSFDMSNKLSEIITYNESAEFDGVNDYLAASSNTALSPIQFVTIEAWIYPRTTSNSIIIHKGTENGSVTNFRLGIQDRKLYAGIKQNLNFLSNDTIGINKWSHVAFTYSGITGKYFFYLNGIKITEDVNNIGLISSSPDSLYIGGSVSLPDFDGFIDEVRITEGEKSQSEIAENLFRSIDKSNENINDDVVYNLDGLSLSNSGQGTKLNFRNNAAFSHPASNPLQPVSPCLRKDADNFQKSFNLRKTDLRVPFSGDNGITTDEIEIFENTPITDINIFVALNHQELSNIRILLEAPNSQYALLFNQSYNAGEDENLITVFDDQGDIPYSNDFTSFSPSIRGNVNLNSAFTGNTKGIWKLTVFDDTGVDTGRLYGWGIQFNNKTEAENILETSLLVEALYNPLTNNTVRDTITYKLRNFSSPYNVIETKKFYLPQNNLSYVKFNNAFGAVPYYIEAVHRNSIGVWSSGEVVFNPFSHQGTYKFVNSQSSAYGNNMINIDTSPLRFGIYSGDVNQDEVVDITDGSLIDNDGLNFASGYIPTDLNGDNITDLTDGVYADNNGFNFVVKITP